MSNTSITNVQNSDTFQVWINKTNELVDLVNSNVVLAGLGSPVEVTGNAAITGTFTANTLTSSNGTIGNLSVLTLERAVDADEQIVSSSPMKIQSSIENIFDLQTSSGNKPILRMINGGNAKWVLGQQTDSGSSGFGIGTEGTSTPQVTISQSGRLAANELQGNGSLLTNLNANNVSSGTLNAARIPNLNADKITAGTFNPDRIPSLNANKITDGVLGLAQIPNLPASRTTSGTFADARIPNLNASKITAGTFADARIPNLNASKITAGTFDDARLPSNIVRDSRRLIGGAGINVTPGNGDLSADRTISVVQLTQAQVTNASSTVFGAVSGQRLAQAISALGLGNANATFQVFTSSGTWTKPAGASMVYVEVLSGGGSGGVARRSTAAAAGGGAGGSVARAVYRAVDLPGSVSVVVGSGGSARSRSSNGSSNGNAGGNSSFGALTVRGGRGGNAAATGSFGQIIQAGGGSSGYVSGGDGGGASARSTDEGIQGTVSAGAGRRNLHGGGGGGGAAVRDISVTASASGGASTNFGSGGNGVANSSPAGSGSIPGGGGGGCARRSGTATSGAGARGEVRIWTW